MRTASSRYLGSVSSPATPFSSIHSISFAQPRSPKVWFTAITYMPSAVGNSKSGRRRAEACIPVCL